VDAEAEGAQRQGRDQDAACNVEHERHVPCRPYLQMTAFGSVTRNPGGGAGMQSVRLLVRVTADGDAIGVHEVVVHIHACPVTVSPIQTLYRWRSEWN
jgi:hypothetical protein